MLGNLVKKEMWKVGDYTSLIIEISWALEHGIE